MPRNGSGVFAVPAGTLGVTGEVISSTKYNAFIADLTDTLNSARPVSVGGTGGTTAVEARENLGISAPPYITEYSAAVDGTTDDTDAINDAIADINKVILPRGTTYVNGTINGENSTAAWNGMWGYGHESVLKLGSSSRLKFQSRDPGGAVQGVTQWTAQGIYDVSIDGDGVAQYGVIVGTNTDASETDINLSTNGTSYRNVGVYDVDGPAWAVGFITTALWDTCQTRDCETGWRFRTTTDSTASDAWTLLNCSSMSHTKNGIEAVSNSVNGVKGMMIGGTIQLNEGWGVYMEGKGTHDTYTFQGVHFEKNGSLHDTPRTPISVTGSAKTLEPGHVYAGGVLARFEGCGFYNGFIRAEDFAVVTFDGCQFYTRIDGANIMQPWRECAADSDLVVSGCKFDNPRISTPATVTWNSPCIIDGSANDSMFICTRIPHTIMDSSGGLVTDPRFTGSTSGFTASTGSNPPTISRSAGSGYDGGYSLRVEHTANVGAANDNALRFNSVIGTLQASDYLACSFFVYSDKATALKIVATSTEDGNNMGTADITVPATTWIRVACVWRERTDSDVTNVALSIYPESDDAPTLDYDFFDVDKRGSWKGIQPILQGAVGKKELRGTFTWNPGTVNAGAVVQGVNIATISGGATGDHVTISRIQGGHLGCIAHGWMSGQQLTVQLDNNTASNQTFSSEEWSYLIT